MLYDVGNIVRIRSWSSLEEEFRLNETLDIEVSETVEVLGDGGPSSQILTESETVKPFDLPDSAMFLYNLKSHCGQEKIVKQVFPSTKSYELEGLEGYKFPEWVLEDTVWGNIPAAIKVFLKSKKVTPRENFSVVYNEKTVHPSCEFSTDGKFVITEGGDSFDQDRSDACKIALVNLLYGIWDIQKKYSWPRSSDEYWYVDKNGSVNQATWADSNDDSYRAALGNVFKNREDAVTKASEIQEIMATAVYKLRGNR